jgi:hypothetical protein
MGLSTPSITYDLGKIYKGWKAFGNQVSYGEIRGRERPHLRKS